MATINDVAKLAGVSSATVSRVANGSYKMDTDKYRKVVDAMKTLGYVTHDRIAAPDTVVQKAAAPEVSEYRIIVFAYMQTHVEAYILPELERASRGLSVNLTYKLIMNDGHLDDVIRSMEGYDGAIFCDFDMSREDYLKLSEVAPVISCRKQYSFTDAVSVSIDDELAGYDAASHLIANGCRRPLFVGRSMYPDAPTDETQIFSVTHQMKRYMGYVRACLEHGAEFMPAVVLPFSAEERSREDYKKFGFFADAGGKPDSVICQYVSDMWFLRTVAESYGLSLPGDIAAIAFSDIERAEGLQVPLVTQRLNELAEMTVRVLTLMIEGELPQNGPLTIYTGHQLITQ